VQLSLPIRAKNQLKVLLRRPSGPANLFGWQLNQSGQILGVTMEDKRRCKRLPFSIPVHVYGRTERGLPFRYVTVAKSVNMNGALLPLAPRVKRGQTILLVNSFTQEERECRVVYVDATNRNKKKKVAVEFTKEQGDFWHVFSPTPKLASTSSRQNVA
jgi:hypothetical protein